MWDDDLTGEDLEMNILGIQKNQNSEEFLNKFLTTLNRTLSKTATRVRWRLTFQYENCRVNDEVRTVKDLHNRHTTM